MMGSTRKIAVDGEFVDHTNHEIYAAGLDLVPRVSSLTLLLTRTKA